jgi:hypothetical protein
MVGVAISFFFSWILMIIVILTFTVGGHGEKYFCQTLQENDAGNFTGLEVSYNEGCELKLVSHNWWV